MDLCQGGALLIICTMINKKIFISVFITLFLCGFSLFFLWLSRIPVIRIANPDFFAVKAIMDLPTVKSIPDYEVLNRAFSAVVASRCNAALKDFTRVRSQLESAGIGSLITPYELWCKELVKSGVATDSFRGQVRIWINKLDFFVWPLYMLTVFSLGYVVYLFVARRKIFY